jgi:hypothetical protein
LTAFKLGRYFNKLYRTTTLTSGAVDRCSAGASQRQVTLSLGLIDYIIILERPPPTTIYFTDCIAFKKQLKSKIALFLNTRRKYNGH